MRYVIYSIGFLAMMLLAKPLGFFLASIVSITLSAISVTLLVDKSHATEAPNETETPNNRISSEAITKIPELTEETAEQKPDTTETHSNKAHILFNNSQRNIIYSFICFSLLVLALHNPTGGYYKTVSHESYMHSEYAQKNLEKTDCETVQAYRLFDEIDPGTFEKCDYLLPLSKWQSKAAMSHWMSFIGNAGWVLFIAACFTCIGFIFFRARPKKANNSVRDFPSTLHD